MSRVTAILSSLSRFVPQRSIIKSYPVSTVSVFYHAVNPSILPITKGLYKNITPAAFEKDLDYLLKHFGDKLELSFDDGLSCCAEVIAPILKRKGIQATFFLNTAFIDNQDLFYRYKVALIAEACQNNPAIEQKISEHIQAPALRYLYQISYQNRHQLTAIALLAEVDFTAYLTKYKPYLSATQITALLSDGFLIGAHSIDHPPFFELTEADQIHQIESSVNTLKNQFNLSYKYFSFPFTDWGLSASLFNHIYQNNIVDATWGCAGLKHDSHPIHKQRIAMDATYKDAEQAIKTEWLYYQLKQVLNKNTIHRF